MHDLLTEARCLDIAKVVSRHCLDPLKDPLSGPLGVVPGLFRPNYDYKHVKDFHYQFEHQKTCKTYQGTLEHTITSKD